MEELNSEVLSAETTVAPAKTKKVIPKKEFLTYGIAALGQGMIYSIMSGYISDFYINVLQTPLLFVLLLMLLARVWDAISDPIMGIIVDKVDTKWGKMKPYVLFSAIPIGVLTFFMFFDPGFGAEGTMAFAAIIYVLWGMVYTVSDVPFWSLPNVMTPDPKERASTISFGRTLNGIGAAIPMGMFFILGLVLPLLTDNVGLSFEKLRYMVIAIVCSAIGIALFITSYFTTKERIKLPKKGPRDKSQPGTLKRLITCKPLMIVMVMGVLSSGRYLMQAAAVHVARYAFYIGPDIASLADEAARTAALSSSISIVSTIFTVCSAVGMFGAMIFMPKLYKRFNYKQIIIVTSIAGFLASLLTTGAGLLNILGGTSWAVYLCIPFIIIQCIPLGTINITAYAMIGDCLDFLELKTGIRDNALGSACQGFVNKLGNALATCFIVIMYLAISLDPMQMYSEGAVVFATDLESVQRLAMFALVSIVPGISLILCALPMFFYDLVGKKRDQVTQDLAAIRVERGVTVQD